MRSCLVRVRSAIDEHAVRGVSGDGGRHEGRFGEVSSTFGTTALGTSPSLLHGERLQIGDQVAALLVALNAGKCHFGARDVALRTGQEFVEFVDIPFPAL